MVSQTDKNVWGEGGGGQTHSVEVRQYIYTHLLYIDSVNSRTNAIEYYKVHRIHGSSIHTMTKSRMIKRIMKEKTVMICNDM